MAMAFPFTRLTAINFNLKTITDRENLLGILLGIMTVCAFEDALYTILSL
jgi:hypothetical protein